MRHLPLVLTLTAIFTGFFASSTSFAFNGPFNPKEHISYDQKETANGFFKYAEKLEKNYKYKDANFYFNKAASLGHYEARATVASRMFLEMDNILSLFGESLSPTKRQKIVNEQKTLINILLKDAQANYSRAMYYLGLCYSYGVEQKADIANARFWLEKATNQGDPDAPLILGDMYLAGEVAPLDYDEAIRWFNKIPETNTAKHLFLAEGYVQRHQSLEDAKLAAFHYQELLHHKISPLTKAIAYKGLAKIYSNNSEIKDVTLAAKYYRKLMFSNVTIDEDKITNVFFPFHERIKDSKCATRTYQKLAYKDYSPQSAFTELINFLNFNQDFGFTPASFDPEELIYFYKRYALKTDSSYFFRTANTLAQLYFSGPTFNGQEALKWATAALENNPRDDLVNWEERAKGRDLSHTLIALIYIRGVGVEQNYPKALEHLKQAKNNNDAKLLLGYMYENGLGTRIDKSVAKSYFEDVCNYEKGLISLSGGEPNRPACDHLKKFN